jgi:endonuclease YncB( thermonuclease family)
MPRRSSLLVMAPLAALAAVVLGHATPPAAAFPASEPDREAGRFARCHGAARMTCVVDGDTFWYRGAKIRVADINAPETRHPDCAAEARLGARATARLTALLNQGAFTLEPADRHEDSYGRRLFTVTRGGESLGARLIDEGLAERWRGRRRDWC